MAVGSVLSVDVGPPVNWLIFCGLVVLIAACGVLGEILRRRDARRRSPHR